MNNNLINKRRTNMAMMHKHCREANFIIDQATANPQE